jgi:hypothetical protein
MGSLLSTISVSRHERCTPLAIASGKYSLSESLTVGEVAQNISQGHGKPTFLLELLPGIQQTLHQSSATFTAF